jgi:crotonobetaine/carnitine-CoA ligase
LGHERENSVSTVAEQTGRDLWRERVEQSADRPFVRCAGHTSTFAEIDLRARRMAAGLGELGIGIGTRVLLGMENSERTLVAHIALRELGAILIPLMPGMAPEEHIFQVNHCEAEVLIADASVADGLLPHRDRLTKIATVILDGGVARRPADAHDLGVIAEHEPLDPSRTLAGHDGRSPSLILYTSGSTGRPKGVDIRENDNFFLPLPMAHGVGGITAQGVTMVTGCMLTIEERFRPSRFWEQIAGSGATVSILFPAQCNLLVEMGDSGPPKGQTTLRLVMTHMFLPAFDERFGIALGLCWGMTETGATSVGTEPGYRGERGEGYVGRPMVGVEVAIMDEQRNHLAPAADGEICLRHPHIMLEYLNDPDTTASTVVDGWVHSGDRGFVDADGGLFYRGRFKNMIKRSGENISPEEVESVLDQHPDVAESMVVGVADALRTEEVAAVVVVKAGRQLSPEAIVEHVACSLSRWKLPRYLMVVEEPLPRLSNGKLDRPTVTSTLDPAACWDRSATPA